VDSTARSGAAEETTNVSSGWPMRSFMLPRDIGLFLRSARTDARLGRLRERLHAGEALEAIYASDPDPWASASPQYRYQSRKYEVITSLIPPRNYRLALELGCGVGLLSRHIAELADEVLGVDISPSAVAIAQVANIDRPNMSFAAHDLLALPSGFDGAFDLVVVADVLYYLPALDSSLLASIATNVSSLLAPGGICILANHYVAGFDSDSRRSRRIHKAFEASNAFTVKASHRRLFYLVSVLEVANV
jgi:SAM-dependent methyltransferase